MASKSRVSGASLEEMTAEYVGTFSLAFAVLASTNGVLGGLVATPVIAGFTLFLAVLTIGGISGAHINPGITLGFLSLKKISQEKAVSYIISQVAGAFSAVAALHLILDSDVVRITAGEATLMVFVAEALGMLFFGMGVAAAVHNRYEGVTAAAVVGGSLFLGITIAAVLSNGILNPAVAFALNSVSIVYLLAPIVGSVLGMQLYAFIASKK